MTMVYTCSALLFVSLVAIIGLISYRHELKYLVITVLGGVSLVVYLVFDVLSYNTFNGF